MSRPVALGELEAAVLEVLWSRTEGASVRDVLAGVRRDPPLAYTTILTVLDRLHDKELVVREKDGKAFLYRAATSRDAWHGEQAARMLTQVKAAEREGVLLAFLDSTERTDPALLARLSALVAARRRGGR